VKVTKIKGDFLMEQPKCYSYVRFSTPDQRKGDSERRQIEAAHLWAEQHGLVLDENLTMRDLGLSAYSGAHRTKGALGDFLILVRSGQIAPGSVLLIENLDRISREEITEALEQFLAIIRSGIKIVTLADNGREYTKETINANIGELIVSLTIMARAFEESATKAKRLASLWNKKRQNINKKKLTSMAPYWLELSKDKTTFHVIPARAAIVERIYKMKLEGIGSGKIERILNQEPDTWNRSNGRGNLKRGWQKSYIENILSNRSVIGEYQPMRLVKDSTGKRIRARESAGEPIRDYYPRIISDELFYAVRKLAGANRGKGGKNGKFNNLFGHIARCGYCGSPMQYINTGSPPKGSRYLLCDNARRGRGCERITVRYNRLEELLLKHCRNLNIQDILPDAKVSAQELKKAQISYEGLLGKIADIEQKIANTLDSIGSTTDKRVRERLETFMTGLLDEQDLIENQAKSVKMEIDRLLAQNKDCESSLDSIKQMLSQNDQDNRIPEFRWRLRKKIRQLITKVDVYPAGRPLMTVSTVNKQLGAVLDVMPEMAGTQKYKQLEEELLGRIGNRKYACCTVHFNGGSFRSLNLYDEPELVLDFDSDERKLINRFLGLGGEVEELVFSGK
jgi:DNA invertase Pin-like site-specific DNA recombinase